MTTGTQLKLAGLEKAASHHEADLRRAQYIAEVIATGGRVVTADDVREAFQIHQQRELLIGNALGKVFGNKRKWECVGRVRSKRPSSHARYVSQWRLREAYRPKPVAPEIGIENGVRFCRECGKETEVCQCALKSESNQTN